MFFPSPSRILHGPGDRAADLRVLARRWLSGSRRNAVLETTELVNEAYLRLTRAGSIRAQDRAGYLAYASRAMRSVIVCSSPQR